MKQFKAIACLLVAVALSVMWYSCTDASASKKRDTPTHTLSKSLAAVGFSNEPSVLTDIDNTNRAKWENKYGLQYYSENYINQLTSHGDLVLIAASDYLRKIPDEVARKIINNHNKIDKDDIYYATIDKGTRAVVSWSKDKPSYTSRFFEVAEVAVICPPGDAVTKKDPMALMKVDDGWLVLAAW